MKRLAISLITLTLLAAASDPAHAKPGACKTFVDAPTVETYMQCSSSIGQSVKGAAEGKYKGKNSPAASELSRGDSFTKLLGLVGEGNSYALHIGFELYPLMKEHPQRGPELIQVLGRVVKDDPDYFLILMGIGEKKHGDYSYDDVVTGFRTPEMDRAGYAKEADARIGALKKVEKEKLAPMRDRCIRRLELEKKGAK